MDFDLLPLVGAGRLRFGMSQNEIRQQMKSTHRTFMKSSSSTVPTDSFLDDSVHVFYSNAGACEAIEFYAASRVMLNSKNLLGIPYSEARRFVASLDVDLVDEAAGFTSYLLGVAVYAPSCMEYPDAATESVMAFEKGYYG